MGKSADEVIRKMQQTMGRFDRINRKILRIEKARLKAKVRSRKRKS